ncbi:hypothetical protein GEMRC1_014083 [Eukaryota sp. GEM-RC1]
MRLFIFFFALFISLIAAFSPSLFLSDPVPLEFELQQMTSDRIVSTVIANVDANDSPDAIIFFAMSTSSTQTRIKWHVVYDITLGVRIWEGNNGFYPMRNVTTGASEYASGNSNSFLLSRRTQSRSCSWSCNCRTTCDDFGNCHTTCSTCRRTRHTYAQFQRNFAFASTDLNNNGIADVVVIAADFDGQNAAYSGCRYNYLYSRHLTWRVVVLRDFREDGTVTSTHSSDGWTTSISQWQSGITSTQTSSPPVGEFPTALRVDTDSPVCSGQSNHPHLATFLIRRVRIHLCINAAGGNVFMSSQNRYLPTSADAFATSTFFKVNSLWYSLIMNKDKQYFVLPDSTANSLTTRSLGTPETDSYMAIAAYDFNRDGIDDLWLLECPETRKCQYRHGLIYDSSIDSIGGNSNYENQFL